MNRPVCRRRQRSARAALVASLLVALLFASAPVAMAVAAAAVPTATATATATVPKLAVPMVARAPDPTVRHVVRTGDTLTALAVRYQTSVTALQRLNKLGSRTVITVGRRLVVPLPQNWAHVPERLRAHPDRLALVPVFDRWATRNGIPTDLLKATTYLESGWNNAKVSSTGAVGIGQLMPATAAFIERDLIGIDLDPRRPGDNIRMSARYLRFLLRGAEGDVSVALMRYYQGIGSLARNGAYPQTRQYARDVIALRRQFRKPATD